MTGVPGMTAAQRTWLIDEIVRNILAHIPCVGYSKTLASCARVSSALSEPALDMLWSKMTELLPLCRLLSVEDRQSDDDSYATNPPTFINDADWLRFTRYAGRVRRLHYHCREGPSERLSQRTFAALVRRAALVGAPLLPRLEELSWLQFSQDVTHYLHFFSPSLRRVTVYVQAASSPHSVLPLVAGEGRYSAELPRLLDARSPEVEEMSLEGVELPVSLEPTLAFQRLRSLQLGSVTCPVGVILSYCATMPSLTSLSVDLNRVSSPFVQHRTLDNRNTGADLGLLKLEILRVAGAPTAIVDVLQSVHPDTLHTASMSIFVFEHDPEGGKRCAGALANRFSRSLRSLRVQYKYATRQTHPQPRLFVHYVRPLLALRELSDCTLSMDELGPVTMADADVQAMAEAWPGLNKLGVTVWPNVLPARECMLPSLSALQVFAQRCPTLKTLRIPIRQEVSVLEARADARSGCPCRHGLLELWLAGVWYTKEESRRVIEFLRWTFPQADLRPMLRAGVLHAADEAILW
ncbi:hypothetical protein C8Q77DRAFT_731788 [Trametes polyzona]|nr:hypothetical protein C8Q77DRAFT_731788 [Trametes polyzona]